MQPHSPSSTPSSHPRVQETVRAPTFSHTLFNLSFSPAIDALIVGIETQDIYLEKKRTWTRKIVIVTDGESPIEIEDWEATVKKMNALDISLTVM